MAQSLKTYSEYEFELFIQALSQPKYRAHQILEWVYGRGANSYNDMTNIPRSLREDLKDTCPLYTPRVIDKQVSVDGTRKYVLAYEDGALVETVAMPTEDGSSDRGMSQAGETSARLTVCVSTQVGCAMGCVFCATGHEGLTRNLTCGEIADQVLIAQKDMGRRVSNVVFMGQGEPFANYENVRGALHFLNSSQYQGIGARHITVSTCGLVQGIEKFAQEPEQFTLAVSLHAARQEVRDRLMPFVARQPLTKLKKALAAYSATTNRRVTFEYLMIKDVNDSAADLNALKCFCKGLLCHVNLLPLNVVSSAPFQPSETSTVQCWIAELDRCHIETTLRRSRGSDIAGACGQLKNTFKQVGGV